MYTISTSVFINPDALIMRENVTRYQATGKGGRLRRRCGNSPH